MNVRASLDARLAVAATIGGQFRKKPPLILVWSSLAPGPCSSTTRRSTKGCSNRQRRPQRRSSPTPATTPWLWHAGTGRADTSLGRWPRTWVPMLRPIGRCPISVTPWRYCWLPALDSRGSPTGLLLEYPPPLTFDFPRNRCQSEDLMLVGQWRIVFLSVINVPVVCARGLAL